MNIMLFDATSQWSGGANRVLLYSRELRLRGHDVTVCCLPESEMSRRLELDGTPYFTLNPRSDVNLLVVPEIVRIIREKGIQLIDVHSPRFYWIALIAARFEGKPLIITRNVPFRKTGFKKYINSIFYRRLVDQVVAVSDKIKRELIEDFQIDKRNIAVIYDGLEIAKYEVGDSGGRMHHNGSVQVGVISRLVPGKGLECLFNAIPEIIREIPDIRFVVAGTGAIEKSLRLQAEQLKIAGQVSFEGFREDIPELLAGMAITVLPSPEEGMSMSALESMASGVPVVATSGGGLVDIIVNMETGVIVMPDNPKALAEGVIRLLSSDYQTVGLKAKAVIKEKFALNFVIDQYEKLLLPLIR
jgi:glycosyltransferase involved in cell wall biosynthesis